MTTDQGYMKLGSKAKSLVTCLALMACHLSSGWSEADTRLLFPNSDFEEGDFTNWTSKGDAFNFHVNTSGLDDSDEKPWAIDSISNMNDHN